MEHSYDQWVGRDAYDQSGEKIGEIDDIFYDDVSGRPEWVAVHAGIFKGTRLVPLAGAQVIDGDDGDRLILGCDADKVGKAPNIDASGHLDAEQERELYAHYGFDWGHREGDHFGYGDRWEEHRFDKDYTKREMGAIGGIGTEQRGTVEAEATIRNQEAVVTEQPETVRLRKYQRTEMVPVTKEEVRVERDSDPRNA